MIGYLYFWLVMKGSHAASPAACCMALNTGDLALFWMWVGNITDVTTLSKWSNWLHQF